MSNARRGTLVRSLCLGLDVSPRRLGWGLADLVTGEPVACGCETLWVERPASRREDIDWDAHPARTREALRAVLPLNARPLLSVRLDAEVQCVYVEEPVSRFPGMAYQEGLAVGVAIAEAKRRWPWAPCQMPSSSPSPASGGTRRSSNTPAPPDG